ncbi:MAG TPA: hypothetical protein VK476_03855, partial [Flavobacterium sp.]|nr:hypothetical protein [Flavobacterium sp.]
MKKLFLFLPIFFFCFSCSESDDLISSVSKDNASRPGPVINRIDPTKLARVIFYPQTVSERIWFFYPNGLLQKITKHDGALVQTFTYDANSNLIKTVYISEGWLPSYTNTYTYDSSNKIATINGQTVLYDAGA